MYAQTEIFPLKKGLHYKYNYRKEYYNWEMANSTTTIDSGFVQYIILDSIKVNDTTTTWNILEKYNLLRRIKIRYSADTLYWISDSTILQLTEITKGFHELKGSLLICYFPLINWYSSVRIPFYRFADTTHKQVIIYYINNPNYNIDSLFLLRIWVSINEFLLLNGKVVSQVLGVVYRCNYYHLQLSLLMRMKFCQQSFYYYKIIRTRSIQIQLLVINCHRKIIYR